MKTGSSQPNAPLRLTRKHPLALALLLVAVNAERWPAGCSHFCEERKQTRSACCKRKLTICEIVGFALSLREDEHFSLLLKYFDAQATFDARALATYALGKNICEQLVKTRWLLMLFDHLKVCHSVSSLFTWVCNISIKV